MEVCMESHGGSLFEHIRIIADPRPEKNRQHPLETIVLITICAVICGADSWVDLEHIERPDALLQELAHVARPKRRCL